MEHVPDGSMPESLQQQPNDVPKELNCIPIQQKEFQDARQNAGQASQTTGMPISQRIVISTPLSNSKSPCSKLQNMEGNQQTGGGKTVRFSVLLPTLLPLLDKDRAMQLRILYAKMQRSEMTTEEFLRYMCDIVGNEKLRLAVNRVVSETSGQQNNPKMPSVTAGIPTRLQGGSLSPISSNPVPCQVSTCKEPKCSPLSSVTDIKEKSVDHCAQMREKSRLSAVQGASISLVVQEKAIPSTSKDKPLEK
ncbi:hypothetical protein DITRI_Ditri13aG0042400 [Diplodiscus trichospermus]